MSWVARLLGVGGGRSDSVQAMPLIPGQQGSTSAAGSIDTTGMGVIYLALSGGGEFSVYVNSDASNPIPVTDFGVFTVETCDSIHVSAAIKYAWS